MPYTHVSPHHVANLLQHDADHVVLIDIREPHEQRRAHIAGALLCPLSQSAHWITRLDRHKQLIVYCHHGIRSVLVARLLSEQYGYPDVATMDGGIDAWSCDIDPHIPRY